MKMAISVTVEYDLLKEAKHKRINVSNAAEDGIRNALKEYYDSNPEAYAAAWNVSGEESKKARLIETAEKADEEKAKMLSLDRALYNSIAKELGKNDLPYGVRTDRSKQVKKIFYEQYKAKEAKE